MTDRRIKNKYIMICEKLSEAAKSVIPIVAVVLVLSLTIAPIPTDLMLSFLLGTLFLVLGMGLFSLGAEMSMTPIGSKIGTSLTATKNLPLILIFGLCRNHSRARFTGACTNRSAHSEQGFNCYRRCRRRLFPHALYAENSHRRKASLVFNRLLYSGFRFSGFYRQRFSRYRL